MSSPSALSITVQRWPDRRDPRNALSTPCRPGPSLPQNASPAGLFRSGRGTEVAGLPIGSREEPLPTRVLDGALWKQGIWPASLSQPGCETAEGAGCRVGCGAGAAHAGHAGCEPWPYAVGAGRPRGTSPRTPAAAQTARFESPAAAPPTPFELLGLPAHLLDNTQFAQRSGLVSSVVLVR